MKLIFSKLKSIVSDAFKDWKTAGKTLENKKLLLVVFWGSPLMFLSGLFLMVLSVILMLVDRSLHWHIPSISDMWNGKTTWLPLWSENHEPSIIPIAVVILLLIGGLFWFLKRYHSPFRSEKLLKEIGEGSLFLIIIMCIIGAFILSPTDQVLIQFATIAALAFTAIGLFEGMLLTSKIKKIFGFHEYVKAGVDLYKTSDEWVCSIVSSWEISKQIDDAITSFNGKMFNNTPITVRFCGHVNEHNFVGLLWRSGALHSLNKPPNFSFQTPKDKNTIRFSVNENEVLLSSTPTDEERDLYGFWYRDSNLSNVYKRIYESVVVDNDVLDELWDLLHKYSESEPYGLGATEIHRYKEGFAKKYLRDYLDQLKKDGLYHKIDSEKEFNNALEKIEFGLRYFLQQLSGRTSGKRVKLSADQSKVDNWIS